MSWPVTTYFCNRCDFKSSSVVTWGYRFYELPSGALIRLRCELGWCEACNSFAPVEVLSEEQRTEEFIKATDALHQHDQGRDSGFFASALYWMYKNLAGSWKRRQFELECARDDAQDALDLIASQKRPPKCLKCGGINIQAPVIDNRSPWPDHVKEHPMDFAHPHCGGEILMTKDGMRIAMRPQFSRFSVDGNFIEHWHVEGYSSPDHQEFDKLAIANAKARGRRIPKAALQLLEE